MQGVIVDSVKLGGTSCNGDYSDSSVVELGELAVMEF